MTWCVLPPEKKVLDIDRVCHVAIHLFIVGIGWGGRAHILVSMGDT